MKKVKKQTLSIGYFHILHGRIPFKAKRSSCKKKPKWEFKANITRNATFEERQIFARFGSKMAKTD